jgi:hypothetical protein
LALFQVFLHDLLAGVFDFRFFLFLGILMAVLLFPTNVAELCNEFGDEDMLVHLIMGT